MQLGVIQEHPHLREYSLKSQSNQREFIKNSSTPLDAASRRETRLEISFFATKTKLFNSKFHGRGEIREINDYKLIYDVVGDWKTFTVAGAYVV